MTLTLELAQFAVREEDEAALLVERPEMIRALQRTFPGALAACSGGRKTVLSGLLIHGITETKPRPRCHIGPVQCLVDVDGETRDTGSAGDWVELLRFARSGNAA